MAKILLISYDNGSYIHFFPQNLGYLAAVLRKEGHDVEIYQQDIFHWPESHLTQKLDTQEFDMVGLGFVAGYYQYRKAKQISLAVNRSRNRNNFIFVLGGHGPSAEPEYFLEKMGADIVLPGEGEKLLVDYVNGKMGADAGSYDLLEIDSIPWPAYDMFPIEIYRLIRWPTSNLTDFCMPVLTGRGCPYRCTFCYRMDPGFRPRSPEAVIEEMEYLNQTWGITHFQFSDELFMSSKERIHRFCEMILGRYDYALKNGSYKWVKWDCNGRLNHATPEALKLMKQSGCQYINYGIEALDDDVLEKMNKHLTVDQIYQGVENTIRAGITPGLNILWNNIGDNVETLEKGKQFLLKYSDIAELRTIRPVCCYPGSQLYYYAIEKGMLTGPEDFYEHKHTNSDLIAVNFMEGINTEKAHQMLLQANKQLAHNHYTRKCAEMIAAAEAMYKGVDTNFRGYRDV